MSKILVPKELQDQIIDLYTNQLKNRKEIRTILKLPFGDSVVLRILKEHNIKIRSNPGAAKGGRKRDEISKEITEQIIEKYCEGYGLDKISNLLNLNYSFDKVKRVLIENKIQRRTIQESAKVKKMPDLRKFSINDDYDFNSHNGAWLLGFIAADGYLPVTKGARNRVTITLARKDEEILYQIAKELNYSGNITQFETAEGYLCSSLSFTSKTLRKKIESYGIGNNKTFKLSSLPKALPKEYMIDYIRGFIDGDGSIIEPKGKKIIITLVCASESFLKDLTAFLHNEYHLSQPFVHCQERVHKIYNITYYTKDSFKLGQLMYCNEYLALERKKQHFLKILLRNNSHESDASQKDEKIC